MSKVKKLWDSYVWAVFIGLGMAVFLLSIDRLFGEVAAFAYLLLLLLTLAFNRGAHNKGPGELPPGSSRSMHLDQE